MARGTSDELMLRCKTKCGQHVITSLTPDSTIDELKVTVESLTDIPSRSMRIKIGRPPKVIDDSNGFKILSSLRLRSGDTVVIDERKRPNRIPVQASQSVNSNMTDKLIRVEVPADNSCLFTSIHYVMEGEVNVDASTAMRELTAAFVMSDPETYNDAFLNNSNDGYRELIMQHDVWGGAIEIAILSQYYGVEICVVDVQTSTPRIDRFGEDRNYDRRVFLIYDGAHYDALALESENGGRRTLFYNFEDYVFVLALELAEKESRESDDSSSDEDE